jgi:hypothetical protein
VLNVEDNKHEVAYRTQYEERAKKELKESYERATRAGTNFVLYVTGAVLVAVLVIGTAWAVIRFVHWAWVTPLPFW